MLRIVQITTDSREHYKDYENPKPYFGTAPQALLEGFKSINDIEVHVISCSHKATKPCEKLTENIWFHQPVIGKWGWGRTLFSSCVKAVRNIIDEIQPDIVHGQGTERECALAAVHSGYPNVITIHGNMRKIHEMGLSSNRMYSFLAANLEIYALSRTSGVICNSKHTRSLVEKRTRKTWLVPNPIRPSFIETDTLNINNNQTPVFLVVGLITENKQSLEILNMMDELHSDGYQFELRFIGTAPGNDDYGSRFRSVFSEAERKGFAKHLGMLSEVELVREMDQSDALIHFPKEEAFGLVVAEALARNLAVFSTHVGGIKDILENTLGSEMYGSFYQMKTGIANWLQCENRITPENSLLMKQRYSPDVVAKRHIEIYQEVLGNHS
jgi:phosphatidylinositol glycan class A protein